MCGGSASADDSLVVTWLTACFDWLNRPQTSLFTEAGTNALLTGVYTSSRSKLTGADQAFWFEFDTTAAPETMMGSFFTALYSTEERRTAFTITHRITAFTIQ